jgi:hypothetical protein
MAYHAYYEETGDVEYSTNTLYFSYSNTDFVKHEDISDRIDPSLQYCTPCSGLHGDPSGISGMQRFLQEQQTNYFTAPRNFSNSNANCTGIYPDMSSSLHHNSQFRHGSPISYQQSSVASGPLSPPSTDNDAYVESTQGPSTPPNTAVLSPHFVLLGSPSPSVSLYGLSNVSHGCVNPAVIQPSQIPPDIKVEEEFGFSLEASAEAESATPTSICLGSGLDSTSPANTPNLAEDSQGCGLDSYPELDEMDINENTENDPTIKVSSSVAGDEDDDDEYKPTREGKSSRATKSNTRRGRTKRPSRSKVTKPKPSSRSNTARRLVSFSPNGSTMCAHCHTSFRDEILLQKHINTMHTRPFTCVFHFAGCEKTFAKKNEWKRHVLAQHLNLDYWLCTAGICGYSPNPSPKVSAGTPTHCRVFRRKDLYTQHIRRMHSWPEVVNADKKDKNFPIEWIVQEKKYQETALRQRCTLPNYMHCPAEGCMTVFDDGPRTWDTRMEHVAIHLERAANNEEPPVVFGGANDRALTDWASQPDVQVIVSTNNGWEACQPLKAAKTEISRLSSLDEGLDEDAEGEEC